MPELVVSLIPCPVTPFFKLESPVQPRPTTVGPATAASDGPLGSVARGVSSGDAHGCKRQAR